MYRSVLRNPSLDAYFSFLNFWATFGGEIGVVTTCAANGLGLPNPTNNLSHWVDLFSCPQFRNHVPEMSRVKCAVLQKYQDVYCRVLKTFALSELF